jgi:hypothetical protein
VNLPRLSDALGLPVDQLLGYLRDAIALAPVGADAQAIARAVAYNLERLLAGRTVGQALDGPPLAALPPDDASVAHRLDELAAGRPDPGPGAR